MSLRRLLPVLFLSLLASCSTVPPAAPAKIPPPPVALVSRCPWPADLESEATARELAEWVMLWIRTAGCERAKRAALVDAWPR